MARIRTLKPEFFRSRSLSKCSIPARLTFQGLWCEADDHGRGVADPRILKGAIWPLDDGMGHKEVDRHLTELASTGHITMHDVDGERYYEITTWEEHQAAAYRRGKPIYPNALGFVPDAREDVQDATDGVLELGTVNMEHGTGNREIRVFDAWRESTGKERTVMDPKRRRLIQSRLKEFPVEDLVDAVRGWRHSPFHCGQNDHAKTYNDLGLLLRDAAHVEQFRDLERGLDPPAMKAPKNIGSIQRVVARLSGEQVALDG